jgi:hypothetical protein
MDQHRDLGMGEYLDRFAAEDDRGDAVAAVRGHDDQVAAFRRRRIDDRSVGMLVLDMDRLACDACGLRQVGDGAEDLLGTVLHACLVLSRRILDHLRVGREHMKRRQDRQHGRFGADRMAKAMPCLTASPASSDPSVAIRMLAYITLSPDADGLPLDAPILIPIILPIIGAVGCARQHRGRGPILPKFGRATHPPMVGVMMGRPSIT